MKNTWLTCGQTDVDTKTRENLNLILAQLLVSAGTHPHGRILSSDLEQTFVSWPNSIVKQLAIR